MSTRTPRRSHTLNGLMRFAGHAVLDATIVGAHRAWEGWYRVRKELSPQHLVDRLEALRQRVEDEVAVASRL